MNCPWCQTILIGDENEFDASRPILGRLKESTPSAHVHTRKRCDAAMLASIEATPAFWRDTVWVREKFEEATRRAVDIEKRRLAPVWDAIAKMRRVVQIESEVVDGAEPVAKIPLDYWHAFERAMDADLHDLLRSMNVPEADLGNPLVAAGAVVAAYEHAVDQVAGMSSALGVAPLATDPSADPRPFEIRADDGQLLARAARLVPRLTAKTQARRIFAGLVAHDLPFEIPATKDYEFTLEDVRFEVSLPCSMACWDAWCAGVDPFDVIRGDERWHTCLGTRYGSATRDGDAVRADWIECIAARVTRTPAEESGDGY